MTLRAFRLTGDGREQALDLLHVHAEVLGVVEEEHSITVWLATALPPLAVDDLRVEELPEAFANATATGLERDRAIAVADDLLVRPPWVEPVPGFQGVELIVPRGMAFGSGEHASTQAALRTLHAVWLEPASFIDVGTGSGILALYAHTRGCARIAGCDIEEPAVQAARELLPTATIVLGGPELLPFAADCVAANMTAAELHATLPAILAHWNGRAALVLSGMRAHEVDGVLARVPGRVLHRENVGEFRAVAIAAPPAR